MNWKTTAGGVGAVLAGLAAVLKGLSTGDWSVLAGLPGLIAGVGLIFAKDWNVTGGASNQKST